MAVTIGAMIAIPDLTASLDLLTWMIFVHTVFNSMQDVAVDALAVDLLAEAERGRANGLMYASKYGGGVLGGAGMATLIGAVGLRPALFAQVAVLLAIMMLPLLCCASVLRLASSPPLACPRTRGSPAARSSPRSPVRSRGNFVRDQRSSAAIAPCARP